MNNKLSSLIIISGLLLQCSFFSIASEAEEGLVIYQRQCAPCHARVLDLDGRVILGDDGYPILAGAGSLAVKYKDSEISPYLEDRPELGNKDVLNVFLRNGSFSMPPFRKSELPDSSIEAIAEYFRGNLN